MHPTTLLALSAFAGCAAATASPMPSTTGWTGGGNAGIAPAITPAAGLSPELTALRAEGPVGLAAMLERYDELPPGDERVAMERQIDAIAAQRYATVSRLFWFTDLAEAQAAAKAQDKPILSLRMLGRLDEDLSCANSRFFRTALYANRAVGDYLREHYILHWSSERPVPRVTFDFGDGRRIVRTTTGNSAHYVLDETGMVLDVLPGLYAPSVFKTELEAAEALHDTLRGASREARRTKVLAHHGALVESRAERTRNLTLPYVPGHAALYAVGELDRAAMMAQRATISKAMIEVADFVQLGFATPSSSRDDRAAWAAIGQAIYKLQGTEKAPPQILDAQGRALVSLLQTTVAGTMKKPTPDETAAVVARFEQSIVADTAINDLVLRPQISAYMKSTGDLAFETLNAWVYAAVFVTPASDPWLNLLPRDEFTGLPADGVLVQ